MDFFDLHCDTLTVAKKKSCDMTDGELQINLEKAQSIEKWAQFFAVYIKDELRGDAAWSFFKDTYNYFCEALKKHPGLWEQALLGENIDRITDSRRCAAILSVEGGAVLGGRLERLAELKKYGVKMITLTWNGENELGFGSLEHRKGLKPFGLEAVREMEKTAVLIDISHLADRGVEDVFGAVDCPVIASHSNSRSVCAHPRNLEDEYFKEIVKRGGLVGINFYREFLNSEPEQASFCDIAKHIEHFLALGGENVVCMGSDFDGCHTVDGLEGMEKVNNLYEFLIEAGLESEILDKIFWKNAHDFMAEHIGG